MTSTLPVRSPFPNSLASTPSAPATTASPAAAPPPPRIVFRCTGHRDVDDPGTILPKHDAALQLGGRVVEMHYRSSRPRDGIECSPDQLGARLRQHLDGDILGHETALDQLTHEIEIRLRSGGKA